VDDLRLWRPARLRTSVGVVGRLYGDNGWVVAQTGCEEVHVHD
jgi:hypothetical protein